MELSFLRPPEEFTAPAITGVHHWHARHKAPQQRPIKTLWGAEQRKDKETEGESEAEEDEVEN